MVVQSGGCASEDGPSPNRPSISLNGVVFAVTDITYDTQNYGGGNVAVTKYCSFQKGLQYEIFPKISYPLTTEYVKDSSSVDKDVTLNKMLSTFKFTPPSKVAVSGMQQYTDSNFGFSFWYPSSWQVTQARVQNQNKYPGGTISNQLNVSNGKNLVTIEEFSSPAFSITDSTGVGACPVCVPIHYYFDASLHTWMVEYPNGTESGIQKAGVSAPADVSVNTMGGLHMLAGSHRFRANTIIPLSARNFVVVTVDGEIATGTSDPQALARTILALDPKVAMPWSAVLQIQTIKSEADVYKAL